MIFRGCPMLVNIIFWSFIHIVSCIRTSFSWPSGLVHCVDISLFIYPFTPGWTCSLHLLFTVVNNAVANICVNIGHFHFSWVYIYLYIYIFLRVELLDHTVTLYHVEELPDCFPKQFSHFTFPPAMCPTLCYSQENGTGQPSVPSLSPVSPHENVSLV